MDLNFDFENILLLRYEDFTKNQEYIATNLINFLSISYKGRFISIIKKFNIENVIKMSKKFDSFDEYDKKTHIHGNHISATKGSSVYKHLDKEVINLILKDENIEKIILKFDYKI